MTTDILISPVDGLRLSLMYVAPEGAPKGIVQIVHGMCEHKERYIPLIPFTLFGHGDRTPELQCEFMGRIRSRLDADAQVRQRFPGQARE